MFAAFLCGAFGTNMIVSVKMLFKHIASICAYYVFSTVQLWPSLQSYLDIMFWCLASSKYQNLCLAKVFQNMKHLHAYLQTAISTI